MTNIDHFQMRALGELCTYENGGTPSKRMDSYWNGNIPWITSAEISEGSINPARSYITELGLLNSATKLVPKGSLLLVSRTGVGKVAITKTDLAFSQDITAIFPKSGLLDKRYLFRFLSSQSRYFEKFSRGATIKGITREVLNRLQIPLPPLPFQFELSLD